MIQHDRNKSETMVFPNIVKSQAIRHCILHSHVCRLSDFLKALAAETSLIFLAGYSPPFLHATVDLVINLNQPDPKACDIYIYIIYLEISKMTSFSQSFGTYFSPSLRRCNVPFRAVLAPSDVATWKVKQSQTWLDRPLTASQIPCFVYKHHSKPTFKYGWRDFLGKCWFLD
jgi:hypothetical protein